MRNSPKFDKYKCLKCKYHTKNNAGYSVRLKNGHTIRIVCNYSCVTGHTCLQPAENRTVIDIRGNDYNNCLLFEEGEAIQTD